MNLKSILSIIIESGVERNIVIASNDALNWKEGFNKIKPNIKDFDYEESLNNLVNDLIQLSQVPCTR